MSAADASAFLDRAETDEAFARDLEAVKDDPTAVHEKIAAAGFDVTPDEVKEAFLERHGSELTDEQLDQVAAGLDAGLEIGLGVGFGVAIAGGAAAALAAVA